ncbi:MAG: FG-GAP-like repeat-containing protein [Saprospiraceae bacterium]|jgi:enediyne biosynthesis protein E4|nr:FG-GAP-like repeat-containing protein [Saprospiraceae bacterium]
MKISHHYISVSKQILIILFSQLMVNANFAQTFTKITSGSFVTNVGDSRSVNWVDVNGDGFIDCMITNGPATGQDNFLYINNGTGGFTALTGDTIVKDNKPSDGATWADSDNDGDLDCYVVNWYNSKNLFYNNNGVGAFTQTQNTIETSGGYCETASWGDYDNDGLLDLYVTRSGGSIATNKNLLFHNEGSNAFTKVLTGMPVTDAFISRSVNWTDIDSDGDLDLFVTNENDQNESLYRNDGAGVFTKLTTGPLLNDGGKTMSSSWGDYDNDGDLDVFLANDQGNDGLFRNEGHFNFTKITSDTVSNCGGNSFSSAWSDIDNDGDLDLYVTNSFGTTTLWPNFLFLNNGNGSFTRVGNTAPATDLDWSYGCAFGDYDNDGFEDLAVATCRYNSVDRPDLLYHNDGNSNNWITIKLVGTTTNKSAIGTKIRVKAIINGNPVWQMRELSAQTSYCGQNDLRPHFGLGNATNIDSIKVEWLNGIVEYYTNITTNRFITIVQGKGITGINNESLLKINDVLIYPNPASTKITIKIPDEYRNEYFVSYIYDQNGILIYSSNNEKEIDIKELTIGTYTIKLKVGKSYNTQTIIKL